MFVFTLSFRFLFVCFLIREACVTTTSPSSPGESLGQRRPDGKAKQVSYYVLFESSSLPYIAGVSSGQASKPIRPSSFDCTCIITDERFVICVLTPWGISS